MPRVDDSDVRPLVYFLPVIPSLLKGLSPVKNIHCYIYSPNVPLCAYFVIIMGVEELLGLQLALSPLSRVRAYALTQQSHDGFAVSLHSYLQRSP